MKRRRNQGMSMIEMLVVLTGMTVLFIVGYLTLHQSMKWYYQMDKETTHMVKVSDLAELLATDLRLTKQVTVTAPGQMRLSLRDGSQVDYRSDDKQRLLRQASNQTSEQRFEVGATTFSYWSSQKKSWTDQPETDQPPAVRVQFTESELVLGRGLP